MTDPDDVLVGTSLEQDVQGSVVFASDLLELIDGVISGRLARWEGTGNAHHLTLVAESALVENLWEEDTPPRCVPLPEFRDAVSGWLAFVRAEA